MSRADVSSRRYAAAPPGQAPGGKAVSPRPLPCAAGPPPVDCGSTGTNGSRKTTYASASREIRGSIEHDMMSLVILIDTVLDLYMWVFIISAVLSWLIAFNMINTYNRFIAVVLDVLQRLTEPILRPIRRVVPIMGGLDLSPMVAILGIYFLRLLLREYLLGGLR